MSQPIQKLIHSKDFQYIARNAKRWTGSCFVVQAHARENVQTRPRDDVQARAKENVQAGTSDTAPPCPAVSPAMRFRFGLTASRKVGNAVVRNRCKRRLREAVRGLIRDCSANGVTVAAYDMVIIARTCCATTDFKVLQDDLLRACRHLGVIPK